MNQKTLFDYSSAGAVFEGCYRYDLFRIWDSKKPAILFIMLNPSTADAEKLDPTVTRCKNFARKKGYGSFYVANIFAYKSTDPKVLGKVKDPVGPKNDDWIRKRAKEASFVIVAWGAHKLAAARGKRVLAILKGECKEPFCFGVTKNGQPRHPLYVGEMEARKYVLEKGGQ